MNDQGDPLELSLGRGPLVCVQMAMFLYLELTDPNWKARVTLLCYLEVELDDSEWKACIGRPCGATWRLSRSTRNGRLV